MPAPLNMSRAVRKRRRRSRGLAAAQGAYYAAPGLAAAQGLAYAPFGVPSSTPVFGGGKVPVPRVPDPRVPTPPPYAGFLTQAQIREQARKEAELALGGTRNELTRQRTLEHQQALQAAAATRGFSLAGAKILGELPGQVNSAYKGAAAQTALFAKGLSDGLAAAQNQSAGTANQQLAGVGAAPAGQTVRGDVGAANVAYGLGGYFPGSTLAREGAGFAGAAAGYAPAAVAVGRRDYAKQLADDLKRGQTYAGQLTKLAATQQGTVEKYITAAKRDQLALSQYDAQKKEQAVRYDEQKKYQAYTQTLAVIKNDRDYALRVAAQNSLNARLDLDAAMNLVDIKQKEAATAKAYADIENANQATTLAQNEYGLAVDKANEEYRHNVATETNTATATATTAATAKANRIAAAKEKTAKQNVTSAKNKANAWSRGRSSANTLAVTGRSNLQINPEWTKQKDAKGLLSSVTLPPKYIGLDGKATNDKAKAAPVMSWDDMYQRIWTNVTLGENTRGAAILQARFNIPERAIRAMIETQMRRAGWRKPKGK